MSLTKPVNQQEEKNLSPNSSIRDCCTMANENQVIETRKVKFEISSAVSYRDIKQLAHIHVEALNDDPTAAVKFANKDEFRIKVENMLKGQVRIEDSSGKAQASIETGVSSSHVGDWFIVKATLEGSNDSSQNGEIIGWASWLHENPNISQETATQLSTDKGQVDQGGKRKLIEFEQGLGAFVRRHQTRLYADWYQKRLYESEAPDSSGFLSLRSCFILPGFQRHGIGSALVRYGCERADRLKLDTLVTSTPTAKTLYETAGDFEAFDCLEVGLTDWGNGDKGESQTAGFQQITSNYRFWFMARACRRLT